MKNKKILLIVILFLFLSILISATKAIYREKLSTNIRLSITSSKYNIVFNGNENTSGTTATKECKYNEDCKLTKNGFEKVGYDFIGWATSANGEKVYDDEQEVQNLIVSDEYVLYAKWNPKELTFNNQTINKEYNESTNQTFNLTEATGGTGSYTYTKTSEKDSSNTDTNYISISGTTITILADAPASTYTFVITATDNNSGATKDATYTIVVEKQKIELPTCGSFTYNKGEQTLINSTTEYTATNNKGINAGDYIVKLTPTSNYQWSDDTTGEKNVTCVIEQYDITSTARVVPTQDVTYNGSEYTPTPAVIVPLPSNITTYTLTSSEVEYSYENNKNAGTATITIEGKENYKGEITQQFTIQKAEGYITLDETNKNITYGTNTTSFTITVTHGGEIEVSSSISRVTATVTGNRVTVNYLGWASSGTTIILTVKSKETSNYTEGSATYTINVTNAPLTGGSVTITGENIVGETLTASVTDTTPKGTYTYEWFRNTANSTSGGEKITNQTGSTYQVTSSDVGKYIYVVVTVDKENYTSTSFKDVVDSTNNTTASAKYKVNKPTATYCKSLTYNGNSQVLTNTAEEGYAFYDNSGINADTYQITAKLIENYIWSDGTTSDVSLECAIRPKTTVLIAATSTREYNGQALTDNMCTAPSLISGDIVTCNMTSSSTITNVGEIDNEISVYTITSSGNDVSSNYNVLKRKGKLTITKATPIVNLTEKTGMIWNNSNQPANTATVTLVNNETYTGDIDYSYYTDNACAVPYVATAAEIIFNRAQVAGQLNQIPNTNIYIFKGEDPANYIKLDNEYWRIIGIYNGQLKIIKYDLSGMPTSISRKQWHTTSQNPGWANSSLKEFLNTTYYNSLSETVKSYIDENASWNVGPVPVNATAYEAYIQSTTTSTIEGITHTVPWIGKVGLISSYEFLYASGGNGCVNIAGNYGSFNLSCGTDENNWLGYASNMWTISPRSDNIEIYNSQVLLVDNSSLVSSNVSEYTFSVVPVVYLKSDVTLIDESDGIYILSGPNNVPPSKSIKAEFIPSKVGNYFVKASVEEAGNYNEAESSCVPHTIAKKEVNTVTNLNVSTSGEVSWTNSSDAEGYQISIDGINWTLVPPGIGTTTYNYLSTITGEPGTRTIYVKAINNDTNNYSTDNSIQTQEVEVSTITINTNNASYGTISPSTINIINGVTYTTLENKLILSDGREIVATPTEESGYTTTFDSWSNTSGTVSSNTTITATFTREVAIYNVTFNANNGTFTDSSTTNTVSYKLGPKTVTKYSHTSNVDDTGLKTGNYGNSWTNANITGTDRGDTTKAHVVTISGADTLTVDLYYNGESTLCDWVSVWAGNYPNYTASSNYSSTGAVTTAMGAPNNNNKFGGTSSESYTVNGNTLSNVGHTTLTIPGDTVTFGFRSDRSGYGQGYGYYAIITGTVITLVNNTGTYKEPTKDGYVFIGWNTESNGSGTTYKDEAFLASLNNPSLTLYAQYRLPTATFKPGQEFNAAIKQASGQTSATYSTSNNTITAFTKYNGTPTQEILNNATLVSSNDSELNIYIWFDNGTIYWYTESDTVYFNPISTYMFNYLTAIDTIDLSKFDLSKVTSSSSIFGNTTNMTTLITPKVNSSSSISIGKTLIDVNNTTYSSLTSTTPTMTTLKVPYTITFDKNGGVSSSCTGTSFTKQIYPGNALGTIPSATIIKIGYIVDGYQTEKDGGSIVTESTIPPSSITYYAKLIKNAVFAEDVKNNNTYANANCESIQCMLEYFTQFREKRVDINGN